MDLKIIYIVEEYPPLFWGTLAHRAKVIVKEFVHRGVNVEVITLKPPRTKLNEENVRFIPVPLFRGKSMTLRTISYLLESFFIFFYLLFKKSPHIYICSIPQYMLGVAGALLSKLKGVPLIVEVRDIWPESIPFPSSMKLKGIVKFLIRRIAQFIYSSSHFLIVTNEFIKSELIKGYSVDSLKIATIFTPYPAYEKKDENPGYPPFLFYAGNFGYAQGVDLLVEVAQILQKKAPCAEIWVAGDGVEKDKFLKKLREANCGNLRYLGLLPREEILKIGARSRAWVVLLKSHEGLKTALPGKLLEGMSLGVPVIASVKGAGEDIIKKSGAGILCNPERADEIAEAFMKILYDDEFYRKAGERGMAFIMENFNPQKICENYLEVIKRVVKRNEG